MSGDSRGVTEWVQWGDFEHEKSLKWRAGDDEPYKCEIDAEPLCAKESHPINILLTPKGTDGRWISTTVGQAQALSAALEQAIIHASGDPIQGALARIRGALETLREAGMGEMGEAYILDALDKMGMGETAGRWVKSIDKIVLQEEDADVVRDRRFRGTVEAQGKQYPLSEGITIEVQLVMPMVTPIDRVMGVHRAPLRQYTARWEDRE